VSAASLDVALLKWSVKGEFPRAAVTFSFANVPPSKDYLFHSLLCHMANPASDIIAAKRAHEKCASLCRI
jgi:hypothetical protein